MAMRRKVVASHPQSPYASPICSPFFGDLIVDSPAKIPHPPDGPRPTGMLTTQGILRRRVQRPQVRKGSYLKMLFSFVIIQGSPSTTPAQQNLTVTTVARCVSPLRPHHQTSNVHITLCYLGRILNLGDIDGGSCDVLVLQQHCGGNTLVLYKGRVAPKGKILR